MGNFAQVTITSGADQSGVELLASFEHGADYRAAAARFCSSCTLVSGESPSYGFVSMPCREFPADELGPNIALKSGGPAGAVPLNTRCNIGYAEGRSTVTVMNGTLVKYSHSFDEDSLIGEVYDDRWLLSKITVFGRMTYDPSSGLYYYDAASPLIFNKMGMPDLLDSPWGPAFAPSFRFGWRQDQSEDTEEPTPGNATTRTRSWRVEDSIRYLRNCHSSKAKRAPEQVDYGYSKLPEYVEWPETAGRFEGSSRTLKDVRVENESLLSALQILARKAGAYDVYTAPKGTKNSELKFVNQNPRIGSGSTVFLPDYTQNTIESLMNAGDIVHSGYVSESIIDYFTDTAICGDPIAIERFCSTDSSDGFNINGLRVLEPAWSDIDETLYKNYLIANFGTQEAWEDANLIWPDVFCAYRIGRGAPVFQGSKWGNVSLGTRYPRIKPAQLTGYTSNDSNPRGWEPRSIVVEYKLSNWEIADLAPGEAVWKPAYKYDNLSESPDGTIIYLSALRDAKQTWYCNDNPDDPNDCPDGEFDGRCMTKRHVRLNLAPESDWLLVGRDKSDPNKTASRINVSGPKFTYLTVAQPMDYCELLRSTSSRPNGDARIQEPYKTQLYPPKQSEGNELFTDRVNATTGRMIDHAQARQKDVRRIEYSGQLIIERMNPAFYPGLGVSLVGSGTIPVFGVLKSVTFEANAQTTTLQFGPPDSAVIYDNPSTQYRPPSRIGSGGYAPRKTEDLYYDVTTTTTTNKTETKQGDGYDPGIGGGQAQSSSSSTTTTTERRKAVTKYERAVARQQQAQQALDDAQRYGNPRAIARAEKRLRQTNTAVENRAKNEAGKAEQRSDKGSINGQSPNLGHWLGKPSNGSMTYASGHTVHAGELDDNIRSYLGRISDGRFASPANLRNAGGMFDARAADRHSEKDYDARKSKTPRCVRRTEPPQSACRNTTKRTASRPVMASRLRSHPQSGCRPGATGSMHGGKSRSKNGNRPRRKRGQPAGLLGLARRLPRRQRREFGRAWSSSRMNDRYRKYDRNLPPLQRITQGQNNSRNQIATAVRQTRNVQIGTTFPRVLRIGSARRTCIESLTGIGTFKTDETLWADEDDHNRPFGKADNNVGFVWGVNMWPTFSSGIGAAENDPDATETIHVGEIEHIVHTEGAFEASGTFRFSLLDRDGSELKWFEASFSSSASNTEDITRDGDGFATHVLTYHAAEFHGCELEYDENGGVPAFYGVKLHKDISVSGFPVGEDGLSISSPNPPGILFFTGVPVWR